MIKTYLKPLAAGAIVAALALGSAAVAQAPAPPAAHNLQGNDAEAWINDPHMHAFYEATKAAFAGGPAKVDQAKFETDSREIFRQFALSRGMDPALMQDHLKLIPGQVVQIAKEDPQVLASYDNFVAAVFGPQ